MAEEPFAALDKSPVLLVQFKVKALLESVPVATRRIAEVAKELGFDEHALYQIELAVDEACANVAEHAYQAEEQGEMEISCYRAGQTLVIRVRDWGMGFDPAAVEKPDIEAPLEDRGLGGLGLFLVKQVMDQVEFSRDPRRGSELVMFKRLEVAE
jgi:serine/threonine-protein kinase RsbW